MSDGSERTEDGQIMWGGFAGSFCGNITSSHITEPELSLLELESKVRTSKKEGPNFASIYHGSTHVQHSVLISS